MAFRLAIISLSENLELETHAIKELGWRLRRMVRRMLGTEMNFLKQSEYAYCDKTLLNLMSVLREAKR